MSMLSPDAMQAKRKNQSGNTQRRRTGNRNGPGPSRAPNRRTRTMLPKTSPIATANRANTYMVNKGGGGRGSVGSFAGMARGGRGAAPAAPAFDPYKWMPDTQYSGLKGSAPLVNMTDYLLDDADSLEFQEAAAANNALLDNWVGQRLDEERADSAARGMHRSNVAIEREGAVRHENDLRKLANLKEAKAQQALMQQERDLANAAMQQERLGWNQNARITWAQMVDASKQFKAALIKDYRLGRAQHMVEMRGQDKNYAANMAQIKAAQQQSKAELRLSYAQLNAQKSQFAQQQKAEQAARQGASVSDIFAFGQQQLEAGANPDAVRQQIFAAYPHTGFYGEGLPESTRRHFGYATPL